MCATEIRTQRATFQLDHLPTQVDGAVESFLCLRTRARNNLLCVHRSVFARKSQKQNVKLQAHIARSHILNSTKLTWSEVSCLDRLKWAELAILKAFHMSGTLLSINVMKTNIADSFSNNGGQPGEGCVWRESGSQSLNCNAKYSYRTCFVNAHIM